MEHTIAKDTKVKKIDNVYNFKDFANLKFLEMFKENEILYAIDIILNKKYHEISEDNSLITLVINEKIKVAFLCNEEGTFLTVDKCKNEYLYYATMYLYILYKYNPFKHSRASFILNNKSYVMKDDFKMFIVSSCGFIDYMNVNFNWIEFFNSIQYADSLDLSDLDINQSQFFYSHIFRLNVNDENFDYFMDMLNNYICFYKNKRLLYEFIDVIFINLNINRISNFEKNISKKFNNNKDGYKKIADVYYYIYYRYVFESKNYNEGLKYLSLRYEDNYFINTYFIANEIELEDEINEKLFFKRHEYNISDLDYIRTNFKNWPYGNKEYVLLTIINGAFDENLFDEVVKLCSNDEINKISSNNLNEFALNPVVFKKMLQKNINQDLIFTHLENNDYKDFNLYEQIIFESNDPSTYAKLLSSLLRYIDEYYVNNTFIPENFVKIFEALKNNKKTIVCAYVLLTITKKNYFYCNYNVRVKLNELKAEIEEIYKNYKRVVFAYGYNNFSAYISPMSSDDNFSYEILTRVVKYSVKYDVNPDCITISATIENYCLFTMALHENKFGYYSSMFDDYYIFNFFARMVYDKFFHDEGMMKHTLEGFDIAREEERKRQEAILKNTSKKYLAELINIAKKEEVLLLATKADLQVHISILNTMHDGVKKAVNFKVGVNNKYYVVKNYNDFIRKIINKEEGEYGTKVHFNHSIDSFNDKSKAIINLFIGQGISENYSALYDKRYAFLSDKNLDDLLKIIKEVYVSTLPYNETCYHVTNETLDCNLYLDKDYNLSCIDSNKNRIIKDNILIGHDNIYYLNNENIYLLNINFDKRELYNYVITNDINIKYVKNTFIKEIYSRYNEEIKVEEDIQKEFKLKDLDINVYFNINDNNELEYKDEFIIEGKTVTKEELLGQVNLFKKYTKYKNILDNFGFIDNKIIISDQIYNFISSDLTMLQSVCNVFLSENIKKMEIKTYRKSNVYMTFNSGLLDVCFENSEYSDEELHKIVSALKKKMKYVKLKDNVIIRVNDEDKNELLNLVDELALDSHHLKEKQELPLYQCLKLMNEVENSNINISDNIKDMLYEIGNYKNANFEPEESLKLVMRPYQIDAFKWIKILSKYSFSGILADDMGLGKSLEIISVISSDEIAKPSLIVCPKSLLFNWQNEFAKWKSSIEVYPVYGSSVDRSRIMQNFDNNKKQVFVISYDSLKNDLAIFSKYKFRYLILDEAQFIKNHQTLKAQSVKKIQSDLRFVLTGTPIENSVIDLWSIFDFLMPKYLYNFTEFKRQFESKIINQDNSAYERLVKKITPFILRRTKKEVLKELPGKIENIRIVEMDDEQRKYYEAQLYKTRKMLEGETQKLEVLSALTRLRQLCVDPALFIDDYKGGSGKIDALNDIFEEYQGHKFLIFSQFTQSFVHISKLLEDKGIKYKQITGSTQAKERMEIAENFNNSDEVKVVLVSLKAGGTGLNLIGADIVIHIDPWWNIAAQNQASDRAHRIGQQKIVQVIKLICKDSIESKVLNLQNMKADLVNKLIANDDSNIRNLTNEDLKYLLE